ncbi:MAG: hypothetical protein LH477_18310 [Nocardioides sp.]|nr:hypothetical protein [Nocardioides sp.]
MTVMIPLPHAHHEVSSAGVLMLQSMQTYPSVSILVNTTPGPRPDAATIERLRRLRETVAQRLRREDFFSTTSLMARIDNLVEQASIAPCDHALALYASETHEQLVALSVEVTERAVVDPTFATRDLVRALHRTPRHVVLVLAADEARLFEGTGSRLVRATGAKFPRLATPGSQAHASGSDAFLGEVDAALGSYLRLHPAPLVVVGAEPTLSAFLGLSRNLDRLAGKIVGNFLRVRLDVLSSRIAPRIEDYLRSRQTEALELFDTRTGQGRALVGIDAVWFAAQWERPEMLAVEVDYFYPARVSPDGDSLEPAGDAEHPEVIDDCVDEIIERVLDRGGWVALVEPGSIPDGARIALTLKNT